MRNENLLDLEVESWARVMLKVVPDCPRRMDLQSQDWASVRSTCCCYRSIESPRYRQNCTQ